MILGSFRYLEKNDLEKIIILFRLESHSCDESLSELAMVGNLIFLKHYELYSKNPYLPRLDTKHL